MVLALPCLWMYICICAAWASWKKSTAEDTSYGNARVMLAVLCGKDGLLTHSAEQSLETNQHICASLLYNKGDVAEQ